MAVSASADVVHRRGGLPSFEGQITKYDDAGITIQREFTEPDFVRWDMVREAVKDRPDPLLNQYTEISTNLWRARTRLERNDIALAEPLFERLFERYRGQTHETSLLVAEGLLRCRLARGANDAAILPALETIRIGRALRQSTVYSILPPILDERTQLCMGLPPVWVNSNNLVKAERDLGAYNAGSDTVVAAMAYLYRQAIAQQLGIRFEEGERVLASDHPGVALLHLMVELQSSDATRREAATQNVRRDLPSIPNWAQAWSHYFLGIAMLLQGDPARQELGLVSMANVPAMFGAVQPYLAGLVLAKLAEACEMTGETAAAASLRNELTARFPYHPVVATLKRKTASIAPPQTMSTSLPINRVKEPT